MRQLGDTDRQPIRLKIGDDPMPHVVIDSEIGSADVTSAVERIMWELTPEGVIAHLVLRADLEVDFPLTELVTMSSAGPADLSEGLTAEMIDDAVMGGGFASSIGERVLDFLQARGSG